MIAWILLIAWTSVLIASASLRPPMKKAQLLSTEVRATQQNSRYSPKNNVAMRMIVTFMPKIYHRCYYFFGCIVRISELRNQLYLCSTNPFIFSNSYIFSIHLQLNLFSSWNVLWIKPCSRTTPNNSRDSAKTNVALPMLITGYATNLLYMQW